MQEVLLWKSNQEELDNMKIEQNDTHIPYRLQGHLLPWHKLNVRLTTRSKWTGCLCHYAQGIACGKLFIGNWNIEVKQKDLYSSSEWSQGPEIQKLWNDNLCELQLLAARNESKFDQVPTIGPNTFLLVQTSNICSQWNRPHRQAFECVNQTGLLQGLH